jgi:hypothetical protein
MRRKFSTKSVFQWIVDAAQWRVLGQAFLSEAYRAQDRPPDIGTKFSMTPTDLVRTRAWSATCEQG